MSTTQSLNPVLKDVAQLFAERAGKLFRDSVFSVREKIQAVPEAEEHRLERCQELFGTGYHCWLEDLGGLVQEYAAMLAKIAMSHPAMATEDPAKWARAQIEPLPTKHLRLDLSLEKQAIRSAQYRRARLEAKEHVAAPEPEKPSDGADYQHNHSLVGSWFRRVADDRSPLDIEEPWSAPSYCDVDNFYFSRRRREMSESRPDRLTANQTAYVIFRIETQFALRLEYILQEEERKARITLATNGTVPFPLADKAQRFSARAAQGSQEVQDKPGSTTRPDEGVGVTGIAAAVPSKVIVGAERKATTRPQNPTVKKRREVIRLAAERAHGNMTDYCKHLTLAGFLTPIAWQQNYGCPQSYLEAYEHRDPIKRKKFRALIWDEKYKALREKRNSPQLAKSE